MLIGVTAFQKSVYNADESRLVIYKGLGKEMLGVSGFNELQRGQNGA